MVWKFIELVFADGRSPLPPPNYLNHTNYCSRSKKREETSIASACELKLGLIGSRGSQTRAGQGQRC